MSGRPRTFGAARQALPPPVDASAPPAKDEVRSEVPRSIRAPAERIEPVVQYLNPCGIGSRARSGHRSTPEAPPESRPTKDVADGAMSGGPSAN